MKKSSAYIVVGLGYGDEGKGTTVEWLTRRHGAHTVVRFNGGGQAGHNVVSPNGTHHKFSQFGSGTFEGARTVMSRHTLVNPITALVEANILEKKGVSHALSLLSVEDEALITTPFQVAMGRLREMRRALTAEGRHGSCGMGIGETVEDSLHRVPMIIRAKEMRDPARLRFLLSLIQEFKLEQIDAMGPWDDATEEMRIELGIIRDPNMVDITMEHFARFMRQAHVVDRSVLDNLLRQPGSTVFEGAQGVLLDENYGFHPHTTWSTCTFKNALDIIGDADVDITRLGVVRGIQTRHGAGPFVAEDPTMLSLVEGVDHNRLNAWQGAFRVGPLDLVATRYAIRACGGIDGLVVTWADALVSHVCSHYEDDGGSVVHRLTLPHTLGEQEALTKLLTTMTPHVVGVYGHLPTAVAGVLGVPLALASSGPTVLDKVSYNEIV